MKKYLIGLGILLLVFFAVQDRLVNSAAGALRGSGEMQLDERAAKQWTRKMELALQEADTAFRAHRFADAGTQLRLARSFFDPALAKFGNKPYRDNLTLIAWLEQQFVRHGDALAAELGKLDPSRQAIFDFSALRDIGGITHSKTYDAAVSAYVQRLIPAFSGRPVLSVKLRNVPADLRDPLAAVLLARGSATPGFALLLDGGAVTDALPNQIGRATCEMTVRTAQYVSKFSSYPRDEATMIEGLNLVIDPDATLARMRGWEKKLVLQHQETLAREFEFGEGELKLEANGRPKTKRLSDTRESFEGTPAEFSTAWNRYFWSMFRPQLNTLPALQVSAPTGAARLLNVHEFDAGSDPLVVQSEGYVVGHDDRGMQAVVYDYRTGNPISTFSTRGCNRALFAGGKIIYGELSSSRLKRWNAADGKDLGDVALQIPGQRIRILCASESSPRMLVLYNTAGQPGNAWIVIDLATGAPVGAPLLYASKDPSEQKLVRALASANRPRSSNGDLTELTFGDGPTQYVASVGAAGWKIRSETPRTPPREVEGNAEQVPVKGLDGPGHCLALRSGMLALPAANGASGAPTPLVQLAIKGSDATAAGELSRRVWFFPAARRFAVRGEGRNSIAFYAY